MARQMLVLAAILGDISAFFGALFLTLVLRYRLPLSEIVLQKHLLPFSVLFLWWIVVLAIGGLYRLPFLKNFSDFSKNVAWLMAGNAVLGVLFFYFIPFWGIEPKTNLILVTFFSFLFIIGWRLGFWWLLKIGTRPQKILILGQEDEVAKIKLLLTNNPRAEFEMIDNPIVNHADIICLCPSKERDPSVLAMLTKNALGQCRILDSATLTEEVAQKIPVSAIDQAWIVRNLSQPKERVQEMVKRGIDIAGVLILAPLIFWLVPLILLAIKLSDSGPIFFRQKRVGKDGKIFELIKFRTMVPEAEKIGPNWTEENDQRVTKIGRWLRKAHLDEIPQLWNILKGEMSFVGPRPERPELVETLQKEIPYYDLRHLLRPGLTGWAQLNFGYARSIEDSLEKLQYDLYYLKHRSSIFDLIILFRTIKLLLG